MHFLAERCSSPGGEVHLLAKRKVQMNRTGQKRQKSQPPYLVGISMFNKAFRSIFPFGGYGSPEKDSGCF